MHSKLLRTAILICLAAATCLAAPIFEFLPPGSGLAGAPGDTVTWNLQVTGTSNYLLLTSLLFDTATPPGLFSETLVPLSGTIGPGDVAAGTASVIIDPLGLPDTITGLLTLTYAEFSVSPDSPDFDPDRDLIGLDQTVRLDASITTTPEPATVVLVGVGFAVLFARRKR